MAVANDEVFPTVQMFAQKVKKGLRTRREELAKAYQFKACRRVRRPGTTLIGSANSRTTPFASTSVQYFCVQGPKH